MTNFISNDLTGSRLMGAITPLGHMGPKHHGIVLGASDYNNKIYVAESMHYGYQIDEIDNFVERYKDNGQIQICPNKGPLSDIEVAQRALDEVKVGGKGHYNIINNNCESFVNRAVYDNSTSTQIVNTVIGFFALVAGFWVLTKVAKSSA